MANPEANESFIKRSDKARGAERDKRWLFQSKLRDLSTAPKSVPSSKEARTKLNVLKSHFLTHKSSILESNSNQFDHLGTASKYEVLASPSNAFQRNEYMSIDELNLVKNWRKSIQNIFLMSDGETKLLIFTAEEDG